MFRNTEIQQKESRKGFFPDGALSQSSAGLFLKLQDLPYDLLCPFFPSLICSSLTQCLFPMSASESPGKGLCQHKLAAKPPLNAVLRVWGSSSSCSSEQSMNTPNFFLLPHSTKDNYHSLSLPCSHCVEIRSMSFESNPIVARPSFSWSRSFPQSLLIHF